MQGRITKVLNMKPPEILGLLEEAAGTKMYETKKQAALRTLLKKQVKVDEINKVWTYIYNSNCQNNCIAEIFE
jgi:structural maintenance of chromosome 2